MARNWRRMVLGASFSSALAVAAPVGQIPIERLLGDFRSADVRVRNTASDRIKKILAEAEASGDPARIRAAMASLRVASQDKDLEIQASASELLAPYLAGATIWRLPGDFFPTALMKACVSGRTVLAGGLQEEIGIGGRGAMHSGAFYWFAGLALNSGKEVWKRREDVFVPFLGLISAAVEGETLVVAGSTFGCPGQVVASPDLTVKFDPAAKDKSLRWKREMPAGESVVSLSIARNRVAITAWAPFDIQALMTNNQFSSVLHLWRSDTGEPVWKVDLPNVMLAGAQMLDDGKVLAWGMEKEKGWIGLFDAGKGKPLAQTSIEGTTAVCHAALRGDAYALVGQSWGESWSGTFTFDRAGQRGALTDRRTFCLPPLTPGLMPTLTSDGCVVVDVSGGLSIGLFRHEDADAQVSR